MTLVSVITPTWRRHRLLLDRCLPSVRTQTHPAIEHIVVSDGPDPDLASQLDGTDVVYSEVMTHDPHPYNFGSHARNHALSLATGDLVAYVDDDNAWRPHHLTRLVTAFTGHPDADFAYTRMRCHPHGYEVGAAPPSYGRLDSSTLAHRRGLPERLGVWPPPGADNGGDPHAPDWGVVAAWLAGGAGWTFVNEVTVDYYFGAR